MSVADIAFYAFATVMISFTRPDGAGSFCAATLSDANPVSRAAQ